MVLPKDTAIRFRAKDAGFYAATTAMWELLSSHELSEAGVKELSRIALGHLEAEKIRSRKPGASHRIATMASLVNAIVARIAKDFPEETKGAQSMWAGAATAHKRTIEEMLKATAEDEAKDRYSGWTSNEALEGEPRAVPEVQGV